MYVSSVSASCSQQINFITADISSALAQNGAIVYIVGRRKEKLEMAVKMHKTVSPFNAKEHLIR